VGRQGYAVSDRDDALAHVAALAARHGLTLDEIARALGHGPGGMAAGSSGILPRVFGYVGGTFVAVGLAIFVGMRWDDLGATGRVLVTLGPGLCTFALALACTTSEAFERAATALFLVAALLQPTGILVAMREFSSGGDPAHGLLAMNLVMAAQQGAALVTRQRTVLALTTLVFAVAACTIGFELLEVSGNLIGIVLGLSLVCIGWALDRSRHQALAGWVYLVGASLLLAASYDVLRRTSLELVFVPLACGVVALSTVARSRTLLLAGTAGLIGYLGHFIAENFADTVAAPILLMVLGFLLIGVGALAVRINNRYIRPTA
jgi:hypothetical protein